MANPYNMPDFIINGTYPGISQELMPGYNPYAATAQQPQGGYQPINTNYNAYSVNANSSAPNINYYMQMANQLTSGQSSQAQKDAINQQVNLANMQYQQKIQDATEQGSKDKLAANSEYQKFVNPYGSQAEKLAGMGLSNSGYSETVKGLAYSAYQKRAAEIETATQKIIAEYNIAMEQAKLSGNLELAKLAEKEAQQRLELLFKQYDMEYRQSRDAVSDQRYNQEWQYQIGRDAIADQRYLADLAYRDSRDSVEDSRYDQQWAYNVGRDDIADNRYQQQWDYNIGRDDITDKRYLDELVYARQQDALSNSNYAQQIAYQQDRDKADDARRAEEWAYNVMDTDRKFEAAQGGKTGTSSSSQGVDLFGGVQGGGGGTATAADLESLSGKIKVYVNKGYPGSALSLIAMYAAQHGLSDAQRDALVEKFGLDVYF